MSDDQPVRKFARFSRVSTEIIPASEDQEAVIGVGTVDAYMVPAPNVPLAVLLRLDKKDFKPDVWARIAPSMGPCIFRQFEEDGLTLVAKGPVYVQASPVYSGGARPAPAPVAPTKSEDVIKPVINQPKEPIRESKPAPKPEPKPKTAAVIESIEGVPDQPELHQIWNSKRSPSRYEIYKMGETLDDLTLKEIGIAYTRKVTWEILRKNYIFGGMNA